MGIRTSKIIGPSGQRLLARDLAKNSYITAEGGKWLYRAGNVAFKKPVEPVKWLLHNKPAYDVYPMGFLVSCLGIVNKYVENNIRLIHIFASAYEYIQKNELARTELNRAFQSLGKKAEEVRPYMLRQRMNLSYFTVRNDVKRHSKQGELEALINDDNRLNRTPIARGYLNTIIEVYLELNDHFPRK